MKRKTYLTCFHFPVHLVLIQPKGCFFWLYKGVIMPWYTLQARTGHESKIIREIEKKISEQKISGVNEIFCPEDTVITTRNGKQYEKKVKIFRNYIFINMDYSERNWHEFRTISGSNGFIGDKSKPAITSDKEIENIKINLADRIGPNAKPLIEFAINDEVRIKDGAFRDYTGTIKEVDISKNKASVNVVIFGRSTPVETLLDTIEKI